VEVALPEAPRSKKARQQRVSGFEFGLQKKKLREVFKREGRYLLRTNLKETDPAKVWEFYLQVVEVEEAFKNFTWPIPTCLPLTPRPIKATFFLRNWQRRTRTAHSR
jgi:hypothetical protein